MIVRTDPDEHRIALLSIPRDLRVEIPGRGLDKVNAAYAYGGTTLAVRTVESLLSIPINHVVVVDFSKFKELIDTLGGVTINVPKKILSNKFECPLSTQADCDRWPGWRFQKGVQTMDGRRALVYARIRVNELDPAENDITRGERQQAVIQAIADEITSFGTFLRMPFIGDELVAPLATDLSANQLLQLGWVKRRTPSSGILRCRLGGSIADIDGQSFIIGSEDNASVVAMVEGKVAPLRPRPGPAPSGRAAASAGATNPPSGDGASRRSDEMTAVPPGRQPLLGLGGLRPGGLRLGLVRLRLLAGVPARLAAAIAVRRARTPVAAPVIGRVEARALEVDRSRIEHLRDRPCAADLAHLGRRIRHALEQLEGVAVWAAIFVDRHGGKAAPCRAKC